MADKEIWRVAYKGKSLAYTTAFEVDPKKVTVTLKRVDSDEEGRDLSYPIPLTGRNSALITRLMVGGIYEIAFAKGGTSVYYNDVKFTGDTVEKALAMQWLAEQKAEMALLDMAKLEAKLTAEYEYGKCLDPIRAAYARAIGKKRSMILAQAVAYITRG